jgi:hypothetical protein
MTGTGGNNMNYWLLAICAVLPLGFVVFWLYMRHRFIRKEMDDVVAKCQEIEEKCKEGYAVFYPPEGEEYLYKKLAKKGILWANPVGGYSFAEAKGNMWAEAAPKGMARVRPENYKDDDGVVQVFKDEEGNVIRIVTEEDIEKEKSNDDSISVH